MTDTFKKLGQAVVGAAATPVYKLPNGTSTIIKQIRVVNTSSSVADSITLWDGLTALAASAPTTTSQEQYMILPPISIDAGGFAEFEGTITLPSNAAAGYCVAAKGVNGTLTVTLYGLEIT